MRLTRLERIFILLLIAVGVFFFARRMVSGHSGEPRFQGHWEGVIEGTRHDMITLETADGTVRGVAATVPPPDVDQVTQVFRIEGTRAGQETAIVLSNASTVRGLMLKFVKKDRVAGFSYTEGSGRDTVILTRVR